MPTIHYTVLDGEMLSENRVGTKRDFVPNPLGSTIALLDNTQTKTDTFSYWPYGETITGSNATSFRFCGTLGYYHETGNTLYVRARYYRQLAGRWQTEDPIGFASGDWNLYRYVSTSPLTSVDPTGLVEQIYWYVPLELRPKPDSDLSTGNPLGHGRYCGVSRAGPGDPIDCIDIACRSHDACLPTWIDFCNPFTQYKCNSEFCGAALLCIGTGPKSCDSAPNPTKCRTAAALAALYACGMTAGSPAPRPDRRRYID